MDMQPKPEETSESHRPTIGETIGNPDANIGATKPRNKGWANLVRPPKGTTPNPSGRPKKDYDLAREAQKHAKKAVETLVEAMTDPEAPWPVRTNAASTLLDRGFGRAPQSIMVDAKVDFGAEFEAFVRQLSTKSTEKVIEAEVIEAEDAEYEALPAPDDASGSQNE